MLLSTSRQRLVFGGLIVAALVGAAARQFTAPSSNLYWIGTLLMVMWIPIAGNIVWFFARKRRPVSVAPQFSSDAPFVPHALVELTLLQGAGDGPRQTHSGGEHRCVLVVGTEGFSVRFVLPPDTPFGAADALQTEVQFLVPEKALARFAAGVSFQVLVGRTVVGNGKVMAVVNRMLAE